MSGQNPIEEAFERGYIEGKASLVREILRVVLVHLPAAERNAARMVLELDEARAVLRRVCSRHGDNDWDDSLYLADVIDKHLAKYLDPISGETHLYPEDMEEVEEL